MTLTVYLYFVSVKNATAVEFFADFFHGLSISILRENLQNYRCGERVNFIIALGVYGISEWNIAAISFAFEGIFFLPPLDLDA